MKCGPGTDFLVRLASGKTLALEIKGIDSPQNKAKRDALSEWFMAINGTGGFGQWAWDVAFKPSDVQDIVTKHAKAPCQNRLVNAPRPSRNKF